MNVNELIHIKKGFKGLSTNGVRMLWQMMHSSHVDKAFKYGKMLKPEGSFSSVLGRSHYQKKLHPKINSYEKVANNLYKFKDYSGTGVSLLELKTLQEIVLSNEDNDFYISGDDYTIWLKQ